MRRFAPLLTLAAVAALGVGLVAVNTSAAAPEAPAPTAAAPAAPGATSGPVPAATADSAQPTPQTPTVAEKAYAGRSAGDEVTVAIAVKDGRAVGYVCDGKKIEAWLEGTVDGDQVALRSASGRTTVTGTLDAAQAFGTVAVGSRSWPYSAAGVEAPAGLYEGRADVRGVATRIGWIVEGDGRVTGLATAAGSDEPRTAPAFDPAAPDRTAMEGVPVTVTAVDGGSTVVHR